MTDWEALEVKPFKLADVPADLQWCIYPEELARGEVLLPETIYKVVLVLRWILSYTDHGIDQEFETWKVYWKTDGKYGFNTQIILFREKVEQYDEEGELCELQPQTWIKLANLKCSNGEGIITHVTLNGSQPYGGKWEMNGASGVQRLLEDAIRGSQATSDYVDQTADRTRTHRISGCQEPTEIDLSFMLECDHVYVRGIDITINYTYYPQSSYNLAEYH